MNASRMRLLWAAVVCLLVAGGLAPSKVRAAGVQIHISRTFANWRIEGNQNNAYLGRVTRPAGDLNGDGYPDLVVGLDEFDDGALVAAGAAFVFYGGPNGYGANPDWQARGLHANAQLGYSVSPAGDVNGDGFDDLIIGTVRYSGALVEQGRADVYYGSAAGLPAAPSWTLLGEAANVYLGYIVNSAGDVNGDGYDDVSIYCGQPDWAGRLLLYYGSPTGLKPSPTPQNADWSQTGTQPSGSFGYTVWPVDANGDGYGDLLVGSHTLDNHHADEGMVLLYRGSPGGLETTDVWQYSGGQTGATLGALIVSGRDVNGDGHPDVLIGAEMYDGGEADEGAAFLFYGNGDTFSAAPDWTFEPNQANAHGGRYAALPGDLNGDGYEDLAVSAYTYDYNQVDEGAVFIFLGSSSGFAPGSPDNADWVIEGDQAGGGFGFGLYAAGDVNLDGLSDLAVGGTNYSRDQSGEGEAMLFYGAQAGVVTRCAGTDRMGGLEWAALNQSPVAFECQGTIPFEKEIPIASALTIDGAGKNIIFSGQQKTRLFNVAAGGNLTLKNLTLQSAWAIAPNGGDGSGGGAGGMGGSAYGGAIYNQGTLTVERVRFTDNRAVGGNGGTGSYGYYYRYCTFYGCYTTYYPGGSGGQAGAAQGGAIYSTGSLTIIASSFDNNQARAGNGGAAGVGYYVTDTGCAAPGGAASGGAVYSQSAPVLITNSTFSGNQAAGGSGSSSPNTSGCTYNGLSMPGQAYGGAVAGTGSGDVLITQSSFKGNATDVTAGFMFDVRSAAPGGGLFNSGGVLTLAGTLLEDNPDRAAGYAPRAGNCGGAIGSLGGNLSSDATCALAGTGDVNDTPALTGDYGFYGGPTPTLPLLSGSPALGSGTYCVDADQRGVSRLPGTACDIGAYEALWAQVSPLDQAVLEGQDAGLTISLDQPAPFALEVAVQVSAGTALPGSDYAAPPEPWRVSFLPGVQSQPGAISIVADGLPEGEEAFSAWLSSNGWVLASAQAAAVVHIPGTPLAENDTLTTQEHLPASVAVLANDVDYDNNPLTIAAAGAPAHGSVVINPDHTLTYTPSGHYFGPDQFTYTIDNGLQGTATATVTVQVEPVNDAPDAQADSYTGQFQHLLEVTAGAGVLSNDGDVDGDPLEAVLVTDPEHGTLEFHADGSFTYTPQDGYMGPDAFVYRSFDGTAYSADTTVSLLVGGFKVHIPIVIR